MKIKIDNYSFNPTAKTVTFNDYPSIRLDAVLLITDVTANTIIYNFADVTKGGTVFGNVLTLTYNTTALNSTDSLLIYYDDTNLPKDKDYATGTTQKNVLGELQEEYASTRVTEDGLGTADLLMLAMDRGQDRTPLQVQLPKDLKQEVDGGLFIADMKGPINWISQDASSPIVIDCTGYQSAIVSKVTAGILTPTVSNDGINYYGTLAGTVTSATALASTIPTAAGVYIIPVVSKYLKITGPASSIQCTIFLSQTPLNIGAIAINPPVNLTQLAGTGPVTAGVAGTLAVGGNLAQATAPTTYPLQVGGVDDIKGPTAATTALIRRSLTDSYGRMQIGTTTGQGTGQTSTPTLNDIGYLASYKNILEVQDTTMTEGYSQVDLLNQILLELKILNQQLYELPRLQQTGMVSVDPPEFYRNDPSIFIT